MSPDVGARSQVPGEPRIARRPGAVAALLALAAAAALAVVATQQVFVASQTGQLVEEIVRNGNHVGQAPLLPRLPQVLAVVSVSSLAAALLFAITVGVLRSHWRSALAAFLIVAGSTTTTELLKRQVFHRPDLSDGGMNTLPSGHTAVAASVAVASVLVSPRRLRPVVALLTTAYAVATGVATVVADWHRPSDVLAAYGVVLAWAALVAALVVGIWPPPPARGWPDRSHRITALLLTSSALPLAALSVGVLVSTERNVDRNIGDIRRFAAYAGSLSGLAAACLVLMAIWLLVVPLIDEAGRGDGRGA